MPDGILIIDKPQGWTSMDVCCPTRRGRVGTLLIDDPRRK